VPDPSAISCYLESMQALVWDGHKICATGHDRPAAPPGWAVVRVRLAGICNTDLEILKGYMGFRGVLGHEFVGVVDEGPSAWLGRRVVGEINFACGTCAACREALGRHCAARQVMGILGADGSFAEYVAVPVTNLHAVPDDVSEEAAVFTEPLAAAFEILEQLTLRPGETCTVLGDGKLGLLVAQVLHQSGARVLAVGNHLKKLAILSRRGIATSLSGDWSREPSDVVVEATGSTTGFALALSVTRPRGRLVLKSTLAENAALSLAPVVINEVTVVGSRCGPFAPALRALREGTVDVRSLISARFPLADGPRALRRAAERGVLKVLLECGEGQRGSLF
jgi:threonine dehydrogenase-like Zn-dependent dehydrogenase